MVGVSETARRAQDAGNRSAGAPSPRRKDERMIVFLEPPAQYDHPYPGQVVEQRLSRLQIIVTCHGPAESCSWLDNGVCHIVLPQEENDTRLIAYIREHEMGHCNGWPSHHPNARRIEYDPDAKNVPKSAAPKGNGPNNGHLKLEFN